MSGGGAGPYFSRMSRGQDSALPAIRAHHAPSLVRSIKSVHASSVGCGKVRLEQLCTVSNATDCLVHIGNPSVCSVYISAAVRCIIPLVLRHLRFES